MVTMLCSLGEGFAQMIVCQCKGVSDTAVRKAIRDGASTVEQVGKACSAGTDCGGCHPTIEKLIEIELAPTLPNMANSRLFDALLPLDVHS